MAKSDIDQRFEANPLAFLKLHTLQPQDYKNLAHNVFNHGTYTQPGGAALDSVLTVQSRANQIAYSKLEVIQDPTFHNVLDHNSYKMFFKLRMGVTDTLADYIPCWFLPWTSNHVTKLTISPKIPPRPGGGAATTTQVDPEIFFTAAINGCSVLVTGNPNSPTIAHGGTSDPRSKIGAPNAFQYGSSRQHWTNIFAQDQQAAGNNGPIFGVHKEDYVSRANTGTTTEGAEYTRYFETTQANNMRVEEVMPKGAVFGLRDAGGNWSFYLQKSVTITFTRLKKSKNPFKTTYKPVKTVSPAGNTVFSQETVTIPVQLVKFFPGGGAAPDAYLPPATVKFVLNAYV